MPKCVNGDYLYDTFHAQQLNCTNNSETKKYRFIVPDDKNFIFSPDYDLHKITRYYQVCGFKNTESNKFHARRFTINVNNEFVDVKDIRLNDKQYKKLLDNIPPNQYKLFSTYSLSNVNYPSFSDILTAQSDILCNNFNYTGCMPFR